MEDYIGSYDFLDQGYILGLGFDEGVLFFEIMSREPKYFEYTFDTIDAGSALSDWTDMPKDSTRRYLEPTDKKQIYQLYYGIKPTAAWLYLRFPSYTDRWTLIDQIIPGNTNGALPGDLSPYEKPSIATELFTLKDIYPKFQIYNPTDEAITPVMRVIGMSYEYIVIRDKKAIKDYLEGRRRRKLYFLGGNEPHTKAPQWLVSINGIRELLSYSKKVLEELALSAQ